MVISLLTILAPVTCITVSVSGPDIISDNFFFSFFLESQWVIDFQTYKDDLLIHYIIIQRNMFFLGHLVCIHLLCDQLQECIQNFWVSLYFLCYINDYHLFPLRDLRSASRPGVRSLFIIGLFGWSRAWIKLN